MTFKSIVLAASLLLFGVAPYAQAQEGQVNLLEGKIQPIMVCIEGGYAYLDALWAAMDSNTPATVPNSWPRECKMITPRPIVWSLQLEQDLRILRVGFDNEMDSIMMHESINQEVPWRGIVLTSIWRDADVNMEPIESTAPFEGNPHDLRIGFNGHIEGWGGLTWDIQAVYIPPFEGDPHNLRIKEPGDGVFLGEWQEAKIPSFVGGENVDHRIPDTTPGRVLVGCTTMDDMSWYIEAYMNGKPLGGVNKGCFLFRGRLAAPPMVKLLVKPVTLTVHVGDKNITAYEIEFKGSPVFALIERDEVK